MPEFTTDGPTMFTHVEMEYQLDEPAACSHPETVNRDGGIVCFFCGKRLERQHESCIYRINGKPLVCEICGKPAEQTDAPVLTVADVLKKTAAIVEDDCYSLSWDDRHAWVIYDAAGDRVFSSPDESAACAEFLRLTGGEK